MPKLTKQHATKAKNAAAEWGDGFEPLTPGRYLGKLVSVEQRDGKAAPYWEWKFEEPNSKQHLWENTSLSEKAIGRLGKVFEAFGVSADTDTDELIGQFVCMVVGTRTIPTGERAGQLQNTINGFLPASEHPDFEGTGQAGPASSDYGGDPTDDAGTPLVPDIDWEAVGNAANEDDSAWEAEMLLELGQALGLDDSQFTWPDFGVAVGEAMGDDELDSDVYAGCLEIIEAKMPATSVGDEEPF
jgi:hypothetical protein